MVYILVNNLTKEVLHPGSSYRSSNPITKHKDVGGRLSKAELSARCSEGESRIGCI